MRRLLAFLGGVLSGGAIGTAAALLFTPISGDSFRQGLRDRYAAALQAGEAASARKRQELEAQWSALTGLRPAESPDRPPVVRES